MASACLSSDLCDLWEETEQRRENEKREREETEQTVSAQIQVYKKQRTDLISESSAGNASSASSGTHTPPRNMEKDCAKTSRKIDPMNQQELDKELATFILKYSGILSKNCVSVRPMLYEDPEILFRQLRAEFIKVVASLCRSHMFYFGIAANPPQRCHNKENGHLLIPSRDGFTYEAMHLLAYGCSTIIGDFEDFLIKHAWLHQDGPRCLNQAKGRGGQGTKDDAQYLYICNREHQPEDMDRKYSTGRQKFLSNEANRVEIESMYD
jgi:hypothetical protein